MIYDTIIKKHIAGALLLLLATNGCCATEILKGDVEPLVDISFSFPILPHVATRSGEMLYVGASADIDPMNKENDKNKFSLSAVRRDDTFFGGLMPAKACSNAMRGSIRPEPRIL